MDWNLKKKKKKNETIFVLLTRLIGNFVGKQESETQFRVCGRAAGNESLRLLGLHQVSHKKGDQVLKKKSKTNSILSKSIKLQNMNGSAEREQDWRVIPPSNLLGTLHTLQHV